MRYLNIILSTLLLFILISCERKYDIVGSWAEVHKDASGDTYTILYKFNDNGTFQGELALQRDLIGGKMTLSGSYEIIEDSLIMYCDNAKLMGQDANIKGTNRNGWKIIDVGKNSIEYSKNGEKAILNRMKD